MFSTQAGCVSHQSKPGAACLVESPQVSSFRPMFGGIRMARRSLVVSFVVCKTAQFSRAQDRLPDLVIPMHQQDYIVRTPDS